MVHLAVVVPIGKGYGTQNIGNVIRWGTIMGDLQIKEKIEGGWIS